MRAGKAFLVLLLLAAAAWGQSACVLDTCASCARPAPGVDADGDGVPDALEYDLAHKFFPSIRLVSFYDDLVESYLYLGYAIPYTVQPVTNGGSLCGDADACLELRFGIAYHRDLGFDGIGAHLGDSEFYAAVVRRTTSWAAASTDPSAWVLIRDFTGAHWGELTDSSRYGAYGDCPCAAWNLDGTSCAAHGFSCQFWGDTCSGIPATDSKFPSCGALTFGFCQSSGCSWAGSECLPNHLGCYSAIALSGPATLYASTDKHAIYHTASECGAGNLGLDSCSGNQYDMRDFVGGLLQNVGNSACNSAFDTTIQDPDPASCTLNNIWTSPQFGAATAYRDHFTYLFDWVFPGAPLGGTPPYLPASCPLSGGGAGCTPCGEASCNGVQAPYISHFTAAGCTGAESYYTPYFGSDGIRRSWDGGGCAGTAPQTVTNRSWRDAAGTCHDDWPSGNTLSGFVAVYRSHPCHCGEGSCSPVQAAYISHFTGAGCTGTESYYTPYFGADGTLRSWDGQGCTGTTPRTVTNRSWKGTDGQCHDDWPGGNTLSGFVSIYR